MATHEWKSFRGARHVLGQYIIRVHTATIDGNGAMYTLSKWDGRESRRITFTGDPCTFYATGTCLRDLRKAKRAVEKLQETENGDRL